MGWVLGFEERREARRYLRGVLYWLLMVDIFECGVDECFPELGTADPGVRVPTFVYAASNQAALLWRDGIDWLRVMSDEQVREMATMPYEYKLYEISGLLQRAGGSRSNIVAYCHGCDVKWSFWNDQECWMCGKVGYLYTPRNIRSIIRYGDY